MPSQMQEASTLGPRDPGLLLGGLHHLARDAVSAALDSALRRVDDYLFDRSSNGGDGTELLALRDLRRVRPQLLSRFEQVLAEGVRRAGDGLPPPRRDAPALSLLSDEALEQQLAHDQMIDGLGRAHSQALAKFDARLAALCGRTAVTPADNPFGPVALADAMRQALEGTELPSCAHVALYKFAERDLAGALKTVYERANERLAAAGVLPLLDLPSARPASASASGAASVPRAIREAAARVGVPSDAGYGHAPHGVPGLETLPIGEVDQGLFSNLMELLQGLRQRGAGPGIGHAMTHGAPVPQLGPVEMMSVLSLMQNDPSPALDLSNGDQRQSLADQLRREVLMGARRLGLGGGERVNLSETDEDALDLVGMLFDVLLDDRDFQPDMRRKIGRMLVPYVKVAVRDRRLFLYKGHPARRLLNAVAEACEGNHGEGPQERDLLERVDGTIDRLVAEYNEDLAIFEALEQDLRTYMGQQRRRIEVSERRAAESQRGRERLDMARIEAGADLARRRGDRPLPQAIADFLDGYTSHHLCQILLREGRESPRYGEALHAVMGLVAAFDHADLGVPPETLPVLDRAVLADILASSGCAGASAEQAIAVLQDTLHQIARGNLAAAEAARLPEQPALAVPPIEPEAPVIPAEAALDYEPDVAERIRAMEIGTWVQLTSESGRVEPAKASWVSPISGRLLFVNRRGIRVLVASVEELAVMCKLGRLKLREAETAFEDAMHHMLGRLKSSAPAANEAEAEAAGSEAGNTVDLTQVSMQVPTHAPAQVPLTA